ncbi:hypothetical protein BLOT_002294 [Blomia tropicalis]|nr:hypothetical protein BLOT_002294 [Blomia tropicalis]
MNNSCSSTNYAFFRYLKSNVSSSNDWQIVLKNDCDFDVQFVNVEWFTQTFSVDNGWSGFVVFLLGDPHLLEGGQRGQDGTTDPDRVLSFWWSNDLDLDGGRCQGGNFLLHTIGNTWIHGGATGHDGVGEQVLSDINVALHDRIVRGFVNANSFHTQERWLEKSLWCTESFATNGDDLSIGQFVRLFQRR